MKIDKKFFFKFDKSFSREKYLNFRNSLYFFLQNEKLKDYKDVSVFTFFSEILKNIIDHSEEGSLSISIIQRKNYLVLFFISKSHSPLKENSFSKRRGFKNFKIGLPIIKSVAKDRNIKFIRFKWNYIGFVKLKKC